MATRRTHRTVNGNGKGHAATAASGELAALKQAIQRHDEQMSAVRHVLHQQVESLDAMAAATDPAPAHQDVRDATLRDAHAQLVRGLEVIRTVLGRLPGGTADAPRTLGQPSIDAFIRARNVSGAYDSLCDRIEHAVRSTLPVQAVVAVVSRGDDRLVQLDDRRGWHFPQNDDGVYAGYYPSSSQHAVRHLEALREKGAQFLLIPATASWWLDHYREFRRHLDERYRVMRADPGVCAIYDLRTS